MKRSNEELFRLAKDGDTAAKDELLTNNLGFLRKLVNDLITKNKDLTLEEEDLIQEGMLGLLRAIDSFDPDRGLHFLTFAGTIVTRQMADSIRSEKSQFAYEARSAGFQLVSLNEEIPDEEASTERIQLLEDPFSKSPEQLYLEKETIMEVRNAVKTLADRERTYVRYRFGMDEEDTERTTAESAKHFHLTVAKTKNLERQALSQVRQALPW